MSDESSRSARPYGQRRNDGAPAWWAALDRTDLPDNELAPAAHRRWYEDSHAAAPAEDTGPQTGGSIRRGWVVAVIGVLTIALIVLAAVAADPDWNVVLVILVISVPVVLAAATAVVVARHSR